MAKTATTASTKSNPPAATAKPVKPKDAKKAAIAKAKAIAPDQPARIGSTPTTKFRGNPDIFGRLVEDHDRHRALLAMIEATEAKSPDRPKLFTEFCKETQSHANAEDQALWSTVLRNPETTDPARHAIAEHKELDKMMADLAARDHTTRAWFERFKAMKEEYLHHIMEEETEQFVEAEKHLTDKDVKYMRGVFNQRKKAEKAALKIEKKLKIKPPAS